MQSAFSSFFHLLVFLPSLLRNWIYLPTPKSHSSNYLEWYFSRPFNFFFFLYKAFFIDKHFMPSSFMDSASHCLPRSFENVAVRAMGERLEVQHKYDLFSKRWHFWFPHARFSVSAVVPVIVLLRESMTNSRSPANDNDVNSFSAKTTSFRKEKCFLTLKSLLEKCQPY